MSMPSSAWACWLGVLLLLVLVAPQAECTTARIVVTLKEYNACDVKELSNVTAACVSVAKCYGRRLVLNVGGCDESTDWEMWAKDEFGFDSVAMVEEDSSFSVSEINGTLNDETITLDIFNNNSSNSTAENSTNDYDDEPLDQWNLRMIDVYRLWEEHSTRGENYTIAVLDSGITALSLELFWDNRVVPGYDFVSDEALSKDGDGRDADYYDPGDADAEYCPGAQNSWHGTKVASVLATDDYYGFYGVAPGARVMPVRVLGRCGTGYASDVADGVVWAAGGRINGLRDSDVSRIIIMALSGKGRCPSFMQTAVDLAVSKGVKLFAAAGNDPSLSAADHFPANCRGVISVGALNKDGKIASYSSRNADVYMPGGDFDKGVPCLDGNLDLQSCVGTSIAVPHAGGLEALGGLQVGSSNNKYPTLLEPGTAVQMAGCPAGQYAVISGSSIRYPTQALTGCSTTLAPYTYRVKASNIANNAATGGTFKPPWYAFNYLADTSGSAFFYDKDFACYDGTGGTKPAGCPQFANSGFYGHYLVIDMGASFVLTSYKLQHPYAGTEGYGMSVWRVYGIDTLSVWNANSCCSSPSESCNAVDTTAAWQMLDARSDSTWTDSTVFTLPSNNIPTRFLAIQVNRWRIPATGSFYITEWLTTGFYVTCSNCSAGSYSSADSNTCTACPAGTYSSTTGSSVCTLCPAGTISTTPAATSPASCNQICQAGTYAPAGSTACTSCPAGSYSATPGSANCTACPAGTASSTVGASTSTTCAACAAGYFSPANSSSCTICPAGSYSFIPEPPCTLTTTLSYTPVLAMSTAMHSHSRCFVLSSGQMKCYGNNYADQLGYGGQTFNTYSVLGNDRPYVNVGGSGVESVSNSELHTCAILIGGTLKCWGQSTYYELGYGSQIPLANPTQAGVDLGSGLTAKMVSLSKYFTCVILSTNNVKCWGRGDEGQLGYGDSVTYQTVPAATVNVGGEPVKQISAGIFHVCALLSTSNSIKCWGDNRAGQLGYGDSITRPAPISSSVSLGGMASKICCGRFHTCAVLSTDGSVKCWGSNTNGQLGYGDTIIRNAPETTSTVPIEGSAIDISCGYSHTCAVLSTGVVKCWGQGTNGRIGNGDTSGGNVLLPAAVSLVGKAKSVSCGYTTTCVLMLDDSSLRCWGQNDNNQLGWSYNDPMYAPDTAPVNLESTSTTTCVVQPGNAVTIGNSNCTLCPGGTFSTVAGATNSSFCSSNICPAGSFALPGSTSCTTCPAGTYSAAPGQSSCTACPNGTWTMSPGATQMGQCMPAVSSSMRVSLPPASLGCDSTGTVKSVTISGLPFGDGRYDMDWSSYYGAGTNSPRCTFDKDATTAPFWAQSMYTASTGAYKGGADLAVDAYKGEWIWVKAPFSAQLAGIVINQMYTGFTVFTANYRIYGRTDAASWNNLVTVTNAAYTDGVHTLVQSSPPSAPSYNTFAVEVSKCIGGAGSDFTPSLRETSFLVDIVACAAGSYMLLPAGSRCMLCPAGTSSSTFNATSNATCATCPQGTYASSPGTTNCTLCPAGTFSNATGAATNATCQQCPAGFFSSANGSVACTACPAGTYSASVGSTACTACPRNTFSTSTAATSLSQCQSCESGFFSRGSATTCLSCATDAKITSNPAVTPTLVAGSTTQYFLSFLGDGTASNKSYTVTIDCDLLARVFMIGGGGGASGNHGGGGGAGAYYHAVAPITIPGGIYNFTVGAGGVGQPSSYLLDAKPGADTFMQLMSDSSYLLRVRGGGKSSAWPGGGNTAYTIPGNGGCGGGGWGHNGCTNPCPPGLAANNGTNGTGFNGGFGRGNVGFTGGGGGGIGAAGWDATSNGGNGGDGLAINIAGTLQAYGGGGGGSGPEDGISKGGDGGGALISGTYVRVGGYGKAFHAGNGPGLDGVANTGSGGGSGKSGIGGNGAAGTIILRYGTCGAGQYFNTATGNCLPCPAGTYLPLSSTLVTSCLACPAGTYSTATGANSSSMCQPCPAGRYSSATGVSACTACTAGTFLNITGASSASQCTNCSAGTYSNTPAATSALFCAPCPAGTYSNVTGLNSSLLCTGCGLGTFSNATGATSDAACMLCPPGTIGNSTGLSRCFACSQGGRYSSTSGATSCSLCPRGTSTAKT